MRALAKLPHRSWLLRTAGILAIVALSLGNVAAAQTQKAAAVPPTKPGAVAPRKPGAVPPKTTGAVPPKTTAAAAAKKAKPAAPKPPPAVSVELPVAESQKGQRTTVSGWLRNGVPQAEQKAFEDYFKTYALARWTVASEYPKLPDRRRELGRDLWSARTSAAHDPLSRLVLDFLSKVVRDEVQALSQSIGLAEVPQGTGFHRACKVNAMLAIGDLNAQEAARPVDLPTPLPAALPVLLEAVTDANQIDAVKIVAMVGLLRHASLPPGINDPQVRNTQMIPTMLALAKSQSAPGRSPEGHRWVRARAIDTLGAMKAVGEQNDVAPTLESILANQDEHLMVRCAAARALGQLAFPPDHGLDPSQVGAELGQLAADACADELAQIEREAEEKERGEKQKRRPGMSGMMMPGYGGYGGEDDMEMDTMAEEEAYEDAYEAYGGMYPGLGSGAGPMRRKPEEEKEDETVNNRRRLGDHLNAVLIGLTGAEAYTWGTNNEPPTGVLGLATAPPHQGFVKEVVTQIENLLKLCGEKGLEKEEFRTQLEDGLAALGEVLGKVAAPDVDQPPETGEATDTTEPAAAAPPANATQPPVAAPPAVPGPPANNP